MDQVCGFLESWDVLQEERGGSFFLRPKVGGEGMQRQINGDKWN